MKDIIRVNSLSKILACTQLCLHCRDKKQIRNPALLWISLKYFGYKFLQFFLMIIDKLYHIKKLLPYFSIAFFCLSLEFKHKQLFSLINKQWQIKFAENSQTTVWDYHNHEVHSVQLIHLSYYMGYVYLWPTCF